MYQATKHSEDAKDTKKKGLQKKKGHKERLMVYFQNSDKYIEH